MMTPIDMQSVSQVAATLRDDEVHVWRMDYERAHKREPLRNLLGFYLGLAAGEVMLVDGEYGRPELAAVHGGPVDFNWSHSGDLALLAVARHLRPGIDIEARRERPRAMAIAEHYFCLDEQAALLAVPDAQRGDAFLDLWTGKEAVLKALGRGIAFGLDRLHIVRSPQRLSLQWLDDDDARAWQLHRLDIDGRHVGALAWRGAPREVRSWAIASPP